MTLVDTSVWGDHFRRGHARLAGLLEQGAVATHDLVIGELACGNLRSRPTVLGLLSALPRVPTATPAETLAFLEHERLLARGLGWIDVNLLASTAAAGMSIWSLDARLCTAAQRLGILHIPK